MFPELSIMYKSHTLMSVVYIPCSALVLRLVRDSNIIRPRATDWYDISLTIHALF